MRHFLTAAAALVVLAACSAKPPAMPTMAPPPSVAPPATASASPRPDFHSDLTCQLVNQISQPNLRRTLLDEDDAATKIATQAAEAKIEDIRTAGQAVGEKYILAQAKIGTDGEEAAVESLLTAGVTLQAVCESAGMPG